MFFIFVGAPFLSCVFFVPNFICSHESFSINMGMPVLYILVCPACHHQPIYQGGSVWLSM